MSERVRRVKFRLTSIHNQGSLILLAGRREETGERYTIQCRFQPYMYVPTEEAEDHDWGDAVQRTEQGHEAPDGTPLTKVVVEKPRDVTYQRQGCTHYEADVPYTRRFLIDTGIRDAFEVTEYESLTSDGSTILVDDWTTLNPLDAADLDVSPRTVFWDIETKQLEDGTYSSVDAAEAAITAISFHEQGTRRFTSLLWDEDHHGKPEREVRYKDSRAYEGDVEWHVIRFPREEEMLLHFLDLVRDDPPDILAAWNGHLGFFDKPWEPGYDAPYVINRLDRVGIGASQLSPWGEASAFLRTYEEDDEGNYICDIAGIELCDMMSAYGLKEGGFRPSLDVWSLEGVAELNGYDIRKEHGDLTELWELSEENFLDYSFQDVDILAALEQDEGFIGFVENIRDFAGVESLDNVYRPLNLVDSLILRIGKDEGTVSPSGRGEDYDEYVAGGHVIEPRETGLLEDVLTLDVATMYPEIIKAANIGLDTLVTDDMEPREDDIVVICPPTDKTDYEQPTEVRFRHPDVRRSLAAKAVAQAVELRREYDERIEEVEDPAVVERLRSERMPLKQILLAVFGAYLNPHFRYHHPDVGRAVTGSGRYLIQTADARSEQLDFRTIYGDSDSLFALPPEYHDDPVEAGFWLEDRLNEAFDGVAQEFGCPTHNFQIELEKWWTTYISGYKKKHYAGYVGYSDGSWAEDDPHFTYKGIKAKKSSAAPILRETQLTLVQGILDGRDRDWAYEYLKGQYGLVREQEADLSEVCESMTLDLTKDSEAARGARTGRDLFGWTYTSGMPVKLVRVAGPIQEYKWLSVPEGEAMPDASQVRVDWQAHADKDLLKPVKRVLRWVGWEDIAEMVKKGSRQTGQQSISSQTW